MAFDGGSDDLSLQRSGNVRKVFEFSQLAPLPECLLLEDSPQREININFLLPVVQGSHPSGWNVVLSVGFQFRTEERGRASWCMKVAAATSATIFC